MPEFVFNLSKNGHSRFKTPIERVTAAIMTSSVTARLITIPTRSLTVAVT
jgi:hypothetical protein